MITYNGERVTLNTGAPGLETLGVSLGRIVRFAGHTKLFYTVLCHSFVVAAIMPPEKAIYGFMHDTQETLFSDVPTPMKTQIARNREAVVQERIYITHGIPLIQDEETQHLLEEADRTALVAEAHVLQHPGMGALWGDTYDKEAGKLTKKYQKKAVEWLDPAKSGPAFIREFKKYMKLAGFDSVEPW